MEIHILYFSHGIVPFLHLPYDFDPIYLDIILRLNWTWSILNEWGWAGGSCICYNPLEFTSPPPSSLHFSSLMLSRLGLWNIVLGNNSIALIISLHNRGKPPLSEYSPIVEGWCNLMWHENSSSIFLHSLSRNCPVPPCRCLRPSLFHSLLQLSPPSNSHSVSAQSAITHLQQGSEVCACECTHVCARRCMSAESRGGREAERGRHKVRCKEGKRRRQRCGGSRWMVCDLYCADLSVKSICV